jgi:polygalacturonase
VEKIHFDARMNKMIDGMLQNMENQDGIDLRNGCHDITISDITGETGDDVVALTAIASSKYRPGGALGYTQVMHNDWSRRDPDIYNIIIRNVRAYSSLCYLVRLLPCECSIRNVVIDGVIDTSPEGVHCGCILLGEKDAIYGRNLPGSLRNITISNVIYNNNNAAIRVQGYLQDSTVTNVIATRTNYPIISVLREGGLKNVMISNIVHGEGTQAVEKK